MNTAPRTSRTDSSRRILSLIAGASLFLALPLSIHAADAHSLRTGPDGRPTGNSSQVVKTNSTTRDEQSRASAIADQIRREYQRMARILQAALGIHP